MTTADDARFGDLIDDLLTQLLEGQEPDLAATAARHPEVADRVAEALALVAGTAGRRHHPRPSLQGYEVLREIGRGGMGSVYLARHQSLDREVALKVLPHSFGLSPKSRQRFLTEARALAKVEHAHIIGIHRILDDDGVLAFEMEYVDGPSLHDVLRQLRAATAAAGGPPTLAQLAAALRVDVAALDARNPTQFFVRLAVKIARALGAVHAAGLVHRDVKPANVLLRRNGEPVLVDFGLARFTGPDVSRSSGFSGTPIYSSPEQLRGDAPLGPAADVYALGVTLYECLTLATPFAGRSTTDQLRHIENGLVQPLRAAAPGVPRDLATIVGHAMEVEPARRYPDGAAMADDLQRLLDLQPVLARPAGIARRFGKALRRQRTPLLAACLGAVLVALATIPVIGSVEAAAARRDLARGHVQAAQQHLLSFDPRLLARPGGTSQRATAQLPQTTLAPLEAALGEYERARALDPDDRLALREQAVVQLALWLRRLAVSRQDTLEHLLAGEEFAALVAPVGPLTAHTARALAKGTATADRPAIATVDATPEDRVAAGLLRFLFADFGACEEAWRDLPATLREQPLLDGALGMIHRVEGTPEVAYPLLQQAHRHFPASAALHLALAETAMALGDPQRAREWLADVPPAPATALLRRRLELDLDAATKPVGELATAYRELAAADLSDPMPRFRLAQLALRQGDLREAARRLEALVAEWPDVAAFRLDRARLALQQRDVHAYSQQVLAVLEADFGRRLSRGAAADLLEILRIGGLSTLHREGIVAAGGGRGGRATLGGELPLRGFLPRLAGDYEDLARLLHAVAVHRRHLEQGNRTEGIAGFVIATLPPLVARLPLLPRPEHAGLRALLTYLPWFTTRAWRAIEQWLHVTCAAVGAGKWRLLTLTAIPRPADLPPTVRLGESVLSAGDLDGDGHDELLIACGAADPLVEEWRILLVDGATDIPIDTLFGEEPERMFGFALARIGDVDGDGRGDWLIGAPSGSQLTMGGTAEVWTSHPHARRLLLEGSGPGFGASVAGLGDVDGDSTGDFAVGSAPLLLNTAAQGEVQVHSGRTGLRLRTLANDVPGVWFGAAIARSADADGDGIDELIVGGNFGDAPGLVRLYSGRTGAVLHTWSDPSPHNGFGTTVLGIGDANGDGHGDVAISAVRRGTNAGADQVLLFSGADGGRLAVLTGGRPGESFGRMMTMYDAGDAEPLLAIGAPGAGAIHFFTRAGVPVSTVMAPGIADGFGRTAALVGDRDGDGKEDLVVSTTGTDLGGVLRIDSAQIRWPR